MAWPDGSAPRDGNPFDGSPQLALVRATRAAMRALPTLYVAADMYPKLQAQALASETFCSIGLITALGDELPYPSDRDAFRDLSIWVLDSLIFAVDELRKSRAFEASLVVRFAVLHGASKASVDEALELSKAALLAVSPSLARAAEREALLDLESRPILTGGVGAFSLAKALACEPLWRLAQPRPLEEMLRNSRFGSQRQESWYGAAERGGLAFLEKTARGLGAGKAQSQYQMKAFPGAVALYATSAALDFQFSSVMPVAEPTPAPPAQDPVRRPDGEAAFRGLTEEEQLRKSVNPEARTERVVNTGFARADAPTQPLNPRTSLRPAEGYYFWLEVAQSILDSIETVPTDLPTHLLPADATLDVALYGFSDGLIATPSIGRVQLATDGSVLVVQQPDAERLVQIDNDLLRRRLFFSVRTPDKGSEVRLRCSIFCRGVLVQSRLVIAKVSVSNRPTKAALKSTLDYTLSRSLRSDALNQVESHSLSVMLNDGADATHQFRFFSGEKQTWASDASFGEAELENLLDRTRAVLRKVSWGTVNEWNNEPYRYDQPQPLARTTTDLIALAVEGYRFYDAVINRLSKGDADSLEQATRRTGNIQIAARRSARELMPVSLLYDYPLETQAARLTMCPTYTDALQRGVPLETTQCFQGECPTREHEDVVCPSGFWGFRHNIGVPVSLSQNGVLDAAMAIQSGPVPDFAACVYSDFPSWPAHELNLRRLVTGPNWHFADSRLTARELLRSTVPHIVYFYCHGGLQDTVPFILLGKRNPPQAGITRDNLRTFKWNWTSRRPLVFINGCHTSALQPSHAFDLVTGFVETANAGAVVGTEITIFEPTASAFAERFMQEFVGSRETLGVSIRRARLAMLQEGNPLGLVYIPFGIASLKLVKEEAAGPMPASKD
jgi:hypothetical protein